MQVAEDPVVDPTVRINLLCKEKKKLFQYKVSLLRTYDDM